MAFPKTILGIAIGWEKLGMKNSWPKEGNPSIETYTVDKFCKTRVHIGREKGELFTYCPRCLVKTED